VTGTDAAYRERLYPPFWLWLAALLAALSMGLAYAAPLGAAAGVAAGVATMLVLAALLLRSSVLVQVADGWFIAGRARIEARYLTRPRALDASEATELRGPSANPLAWMLLRGWISTAVVVDIDDPQDDTPYWFVSTRNPTGLASALRAATSGDLP
jgi:hypothetical protein